MVVARRLRPQVKAGEVSQREFWAWSLFSLFLWLLAVNKQLDFQTALTEIGRMLARSQGGFTTCLVLRVAPDSTLTFANAGHLAPYLRGVELEVINGLPLGLAEESVYTETVVALPEDAQLTLVTDGVVEARARTGELLGFERAQTLSTRPADSIAQTAQDFGQEDDITVLTLSRTPRQMQLKTASALATPPVM